MNSFAESPFTDVAAEYEVDGHDIPPFKFSQGLSEVGYEELPANERLPSTAIEWRIDDESDPIEARRRAKQAILTNGRLAYAQGQDGPRYYKGLYEPMPVQAHITLPPEVENKRSMVPSLLNLPDYLACGLNGQPIRPNTLGWTHRFDQSSRSLTAASLMSDAFGRQTLVEITEFLSRDEPQRAVKRVKFTPSYSGEIALHAAIDGNPQPGRTDHFTDTHLSALEASRGVLYEAKTIRNNHHLAIAQQAKLLADNQELVITPAVYSDGKEVGQRFRLQVEAGKTYEMHIFAAVHATIGQVALDGVHLIADAACLKDVARPLTFERLWLAHTRAWERLRQRNNIIVYGDPDIQFGLDFNHGHILSEIDGSNSQVGIGAKIGNEEGEGYGGRHFWDGDIFALPAMTREQQRALLEYRYKQLPAARHKAQLHGYDGAWFPWEANAIPLDGESGEGCPPHLFNSLGRSVAVKTLTEAIHISADVAYATMKYYEETGDRQFMVQYGSEMIIEAARFLASRVTKRGDSYVYEHVTGPDEYHEDVTNNAYTLLMAAYTLHLPNTLVSQGMAEVRAEEASHWRNVQEHLDLPFDAETSIFSAFEGWDGLTHVDLTLERYIGITAMDTKLQEENPPPIGIADEALTHEQKNPVNLRDVIKQHDTVLALTLLGRKLLDILPAQVVQDRRSTDESDQQIVAANLFANLEKYGPQTVDGSSLSPSTKVLAAIHAGIHPDETYDDYRKLVLMDLSSENTHGTQDGLHTANAGASVWVATEGYMGIQVADNTLYVDPHLPSHWWGAERTMSWLGELCKVSIDQIGGTVSVELLEPSQSSRLQINIRGQQRTLSSENPVTSYPYKRTAKSRGRLSLVRP